MRQKSEALETAEQHVRDIRRATWRMYLAEEKIRIVLAGFLGEYSVAELCCVSIADGRERTAISGGYC